METLFIIPARGGSKGIPGKNIKNLNGKPLIYYSIEVARQLTTDDNICLTTDSMEIIDVAKKCGLKVPFIRPTRLATDFAGSNEVILHAMEYYEKQKKKIQTIVLLQPTSPFREPQQIKEAMELMSGDIEMVVSVKLSSANPYYSIVEEDELGFLKLSKEGSYTRRQDCPPVYEYNGSIYVINTNALKCSSIDKFTRVKKYLMDDIHSVDLDTQLNWDFAEFLMNR